MDTACRPNADMTDYTGIRIGSYRILRLLGSGGMGAVYLGEHVLIGKKVAIKFLHAKFAGKKKHQTLFLREARAAAAVGHRNVVDIHDVGVSLFNERYIVMEYLEGESVAELLAHKGKLDLDTAFAIIVPTLSALCAAHDKGIVHRDLKPDNILLLNRGGSNLDVQIIDFGVSKIIGKKDESGLIQAGKISGTLAYMSPEQIMGYETMDGRTDLYAIGVILYEMLTGELPFTGGSQSSFIENVLFLPPRPLLLNAEDLPPLLVPTIMQLLSKNPADRPADAHALMDRLLSIREGLLTSSIARHSKANAAEETAEIQPLHLDKLGLSNYEECMKKCTMLYSILQTSELPIQPAPAAKPERVS